MTDRELTVLRAIDRVGRGGLALIADVIKALGYPKATVKKTLIGLSEKGSVSLHRHDWPSSLTPAERRVMVLSKGNYYNAVSVRKKNPQSRGEKARRADENIWRKSIAAYRSKGWTYQQIKDRLWLKFGLTLDKLTEESATFVPILGKSGGFTLDLVPPLERRRMASKAKKANPRRKNKTIIKAKRVVVARKAVVINPKRKTAKKAATKRRRNAETCPTCTRPADQPYRQYDSRGKCIAGCIDAFHTGHLITPSESSFWHNRPQAKKWRAAEKKRKAEMLKGAPRRRKNLDHKDPKHQVFVSRHWRAGGASQWQRAHKAGQTDLFAHGIKARNPKGWFELVEKIGPAQRTLKKSKTVATLEKERAKLSPERQQRTWIEDFQGNVIAGYRGHVGWRPNPKKRNASRTVRKRKVAPARRAVSVRRKTRKRATKKNPTTLKKLVSKAVKAVKRAVKGKRNPSAADLRKTFAGRYSKDDRLIFPDGTPNGLAKLGRLVSIKTDSGKFAPVKGTAWLCSDTKGKLHIGTPTKGHVIASGPATNYGYVREIEYEESKPHLGYTKKTLFFHKLGEETGVKPRLVTDGKGGAKFVGGAYKIKREGIIN